MHCTGFPMLRPPKIFSVISGKHVPWSDRQWKLLSRLALLRHRRHLQEVASGRRPTADPSGWRILFGNKSIGISWESVYTLGWRQGTQHNNTQSHTILCLYAECQYFVILQSGLSVTVMSIILLSLSAEYHSVRCHSARRHCGVSFCQVTFCWVSFW
jgi:hypothetical protein